MIKRIDSNIRIDPEKNTSPLKPAPRPARGAFSQHLARNLALAGMLVLTVTAVRNAELPSGKTVLTAVQGIMENTWDERLGKISFVSQLFPETVSVFFESPGDASLTAPCFGAISHPWTSREPYIGYRGSDDRVYAVSPGQVMSLAHGENEEWVLRVRQEDGLETMYYGLMETSVREGDTVTEQTCLGRALSQDAIFIEVRRAGRAVDPTEWLSPRSGDQL